MEITIRKLGNSAGLILPASLLRTLRLTVGSSLTAEQVKGKLVLSPTAKPRYTLDDLLSQCNPKARPPKDVKAWNEAGAVGKEIV
jgi:antitoxin ChpS